MRRGMKSFRYFYVGGKKTAGETINLTVHICRWIARHYVGSTQVTTRSLSLSQLAGEDENDGLWNSSKDCEQYIMRDRETGRPGDRDKQGKMHFGSRRMYELLAVHGYTGAINNREKLCYE